MRVRGANLPSVHFMPLTAELAEAAGISERRLREVAKAGKWRGLDFPAARGPQGWMLDLTRAPLELLDLLKIDRAALLATTVPAPASVPKVADWQFKAQQERWNTIRPILKRPANTKERTDAIRDAAARLGVSSKKVRRWLNAYSNAGLSGLLPKVRSDSGARRVLVSRQWDAGIDLPEETCAKLAARIEREGRSMVANDGTSEREVLRLCGLRLAGYCAEAGSELPRDRLRELCTLNQKWAKRADLDRFRLVHLHDKDHKEWQDEAVPRVRRALHDIPMSLLIGDVHYGDILVEEGEEPIRVRLIAWLDASCLFLWVTPVFLSKGKGICQEDVAESLWQISQSPHGGIPAEYYLDNGPEYAEIADAMVRLSLLAEREFGVTLAKPYSPTSKGDIEGVFNIVEGIFKGLPGWIGGDRTNKKTENKGKVVEPYRRGLAALEDDIQAAVAIYNSRPQSGRLNGLSPLDMLERKIAETGFVARRPDAEAFDVIFSKSDSRTIRQGTIHFDKRQWHTPAIDSLPVGESVEVLVPLRKVHERIFLRRRGQDIGWAEPLPVFQHGDRDGARLQSKLEAGRVAAVRAMRAEIDPAVSTFEFQKAAVEKIAPNAPAPETWTRAIDKTATNAEVQALEDARRKQRRAEADKIWDGLNTSIPEERKASGCRR